MLGWQCPPTGYARIPRPAVAVVAAVGSTSNGMTPCIYQGETARETSTTANWARSTKCAESPKARGDSLASVIKA